jgi:hypothetical protein
MPCFYLHIRCDGESIQDDEGFDFADFSTANHEAVRSIRSLVCGDVQSGILNLDLSIEIWDGERHLTTVKFDDAIRTVANSHRDQPYDETNLPQG